MPRIQQDRIDDHDIYGKVQVDNNLTFGERVRKRFKPHDTVKVINIDDESIKWQYLEQDDESYVLEDETNIKITSREDPGLWEIGPGEQDILEGANAYLMMEALFKKMSVKKKGVVEHPLDQRDIHHFAFDDPEQQERIIDLLFLGKVTPAMMKQAALMQLGEVDAKKQDSYKSPNSNSRSGKEPSLINEIS